MNASATVLLATTSAPAWPQDDAEPIVKLEKIEVTGSHIPRTEIESALPVQVITREDIDRSGSTTVAEMMAKVSANFVGQNDRMSSLGAGVPGLSSVNLRGIGSGSTLVLLNGRRVAASPSTAAPWTSIRSRFRQSSVEILKDERLGDLWRRRDRRRRQLHPAQGFPGSRSDGLRRLDRARRRQSVSGGHHRRLWRSCEGSLQRLCHCDYQKDQALANTRARIPARLPALTKASLACRRARFQPTSCRREISTIQPMRAAAPPLSLPLPDSTACGTISRPCSTPFPDRAPWGLRSRRIPAQRRPSAVPGARLHA